MLRIAIFSLLSEVEPTVSSLWTRQFLRSLSKSSWRNAEVDLFFDDRELKKVHAEGGPPVSGVNLYHYLRAATRHQEQAYDVIIYQVEDNPRCGFVRRAMQLLPGFKCFHDLTLARMHRAEFAHSTGGDDFEASLVKRFGRRAEGMGRFAVRGWSIESLLSLYSFIEQELLSLGVNTAFHPESAVWARQRFPQIVIELLPGLASVEVPEESKPLRERIPNGKIQVGVPGESQSARILLEAIVSGSLSNQINVCQLPNGGPEYRRRIGECDLIVALEPDLRRSFPVVGVMANAYGVPCVASSQFVGKLVPSGSALPIRAGVGEATELVRTLHAVVDSPELLQGLKQNVAHSFKQPAFCADWMNKTISAFERLRAQLSAMQHLWHSELFSSRKEICSHELRVTGNSPSSAVDRYLERILFGQGEADRQSFH